MKSKFTYIKLWLCSFSLLIVGVGTAQIAFTPHYNLLQSIGGSSVANCVADMNSDGLDDVVRVMSNGIYIDYQQTNGIFSPSFYPLSVQTMPTWSIVAADIDGNGYMDLCFAGGSSVSFVYANSTGTGYIEELQPSYIFCQRSTFADIDNDGHLDAFVCHDVGQSLPFRNVEGHLQLDHTLISTMAIGGNYSAIWVDYDNDHDIDLYITKCRGGAANTDHQRINKLYRNNGDGTFTDVGAAANMDDANQSWSTAFDDFDNDGNFDAFIANHTSSDMPGGAANKLMRNNGDGTFTNVISTSGINPNHLGAWNCDAADFDNNGFMDILSEMSTEMYWNQGNMLFVGQDLGFSSGGIGDLNNDGFLDVVNGNTVWLNSGNNNNYIKFVLEGLISNKSAVGARVEIYGDWGVQVREVRAGRSFDPGSTLTVHFGLGAATSISQVVVYWPSGVVTTIESPSINQQINIIEANCVSSPIQIAALGSTQICPGSSVELSAPANASYLWNTGETTQTINATTGGNYSVVTYDDSHCASLSNSVVVSIIEEQVPQISVEGETFACAGDAVSISSSVAGTYLWNNGATSQSLEVTETGDYFVSTTDMCTEVSLQSAPVHIEILSNPSPIVSDIIIGESGTVELTALGDNLEWYATATSDEILGTGNTFTTDYFENEISYWVQARNVHSGEQQIGGKFDNSGVGGLPSVGGTMTMNVFEPFVLEKVTVTVPSNSQAGNRTIELLDANGNLLDSKVIFCPMGTTEVDVDMEIPMGNGLQIGCAENNLFRNSSISGFPYPIGDIGSIINTTFGTSYYYYFYNWKIRKQDIVCSSPRIQVSAYVVSTDKLENSLEVKVYPNPVAETLHIHSAQNLEGAHLFITDMSGKIVLTEKWSKRNEFSFDVSSLSTGVYHAIVTNNGKRSTIEFVKQ